MSYINPGNLKMQKRRHSVRRLTPEEAIAAANEVVDIAKALAFGQHWERVAAELEQENRQLRAENERLERENGALRKRLKPKAGKRRGEE